MPMDFKHRLAVTTVLVIAACAPGCRTSGQEARAAGEVYPAPTMAPIAAAQPAPSFSQSPTVCTAPPASPFGGQQFCPVTGAKLGSMGEPVPVNIGGRVVYVCCAGCVGKLEANMQARAPATAARLGHAPVPGRSMSGVDSTVGSCGGGSCGSCGH